MTLSESERRDDKQPCDSSDNEDESRIRRGRCTHIGDPLGQSHQDDWWKNLNRKTPPDTVFLTVEGCQTAPHFPEI